MNNRLKTAETVEILKHRALSWRIKRINLEFQFKFVALAFKVYWENCVWMFWGYLPSCFKWDSQFQSALINVLHPFPYCCHLLLYKTLCKPQLLVSPTVHDNDCQKQHRSDSTQFSDLIQSHPGFLSNNLKS